MKKKRIFVKMISLIILSLLLLTLVSCKSEDEKARSLVEKDISLLKSGLSDDSKIKFYELYGANELTESEKGLVDIFINHCQDNQYEILSTEKKDDKIVVNLQIESKDFKSAIETSYEKVMRSLIENGVLLDNNFNEDEFITNFGDEISDYLNSHPEKVKTTVPVEVGKNSDGKVKILNEDKLYNSITGSLYDYITNSDKLLAKYLQITFDVIKSTDTKKLSEFAFRSDSSLESLQSNGGDKLLDALYNHMKNFNYEILSTNSSSNKYTINVRLDSEPLGDAFVDAFAQVKEKAQSGSFSSESEVYSYFAEEFDSILKNNKYERLNKEFSFVIAKNGNDFTFESGEDDFINALTGDLQKKTSSLSIN